MQSKMRRIEIPGDIQRRESRNKLIIGIILVGLMVASTAGFAFLNNDSTKTEITKQTYNSYDFVLNSNGLWQTNIQGYDFQFQYAPNETTDVELRGVELNAYSGKTLYFISENPEATSEIASNLEKFIPRMQNACRAGQECKEDFPEKDCREDNIIIIQENNETSLIAEDKCVTIAGPYSELVKLSDAFLYKILGIK